MFRQAIDNFWNLENRLIEIMDTSTNENRNDEESLQMPQNMSTDLPNSFETFGTTERCSSAAENNNNNSANRENDGGNGTSQSSSAENVLQMTPHQQQNAVGEANEPGRRSTRVIKRPKFDDELVESIHNKIHHQPKVTPKRRQSHDKSVNSSYEEEQSRQSAHKRNSMVADDKYLTPPTPAAETNTPIQQANSSKASRKRKAPDSENTANGSNKTTKKHHPHDENGSTTANQLNALADTAAKVNWTPEDDIALIAAVTHVSDLHVIYSQMNFSRRYTLDQIEERWYELLYDEKASQNARKRMESIDKKRILDILARIPFSMREEQLISQIPSTVPPPIQMHLERILEQNRDQFHHARTAQMLEEHWRELKSLYLLADQQPLQPQPDDFIEQTYDLQSLVGLDSISDQLPLDVEERQFTRNIAINEREIHEWEAVYTTAVTGIPATNPVMTSETIGLLCGRCTTFDIRKEKVLIGRSTKRHNVDVNLTLEGPTGMVSRKQAILKMSEGGECLLRNIGKKYLVVDGQVLVTGEAAKLTNNSLIEVAQIRLKFLKNAEYRPPRMRGEDGGQFINNQR